MAQRELDPEHNCFWQEGYRDGFAGRRAILPDVTRHQFQRSDYFAGHEAGQEDRLAQMELVERDEDIDNNEPDDLSPEDERLADVAGSSIRIWEAARAQCRGER